MPFQKVTFAVSGLEQPGTAQDVSNAVVGISGVRHVNADNRNQTVVVEFDSILTSIDMVRSSIEGAGYPVQGASES